MTDRIKTLRKFFINDKAHHSLRFDGAGEDFTCKMSEQNMSDIERSVERLRFMLSQETPVIFPNERIALTRTARNVPPMFLPKEEAEIRKHSHISIKEVSNICADYSALLAVGFAAKREEIRGIIAAAPEKAEYLLKTIEVMDIISAFAERYRLEALKAGNTIVAENFAVIPEEPPKNFLQALQFLRLIHFAMWISGNYHNTLGRFDQYMLPFFNVNDENSLELAEEFFLACNRDSDLYQGIQMGDNGQSLMLGGLNPDGTDSWNALSDICLEASRELNLIDPKINVRVHESTPLSVYEKGTELTRLGLGFPQYSNDDVVIPALIKWGYSSADTHNYTVAACWEFIMQGCAMDIPNIDGMSFAHAVQKSCSNLTAFDNFDKLFEDVKCNIKQSVDSILATFSRPHYIYPSPLISLMTEGAIENAKDVSLGSKYNNFGIHGTGISTAADSLAAVKKHVFDGNTISAEKLISALNRNFEGDDELLHTLRFESPKMGNNDYYVDEIACRLLEAFADMLEGRRNVRGGIFRPGTGSAMFYIWHGDSLPATADGRKDFEPLSANYSPSLINGCKGPVSIIKSFTTPNLERVCNGGPLTLELHDSMFKTSDAVKKTSMLVKSYFNLGGHQLQLNAINREKLLDAQKNPENYRGLIVRVWGWSGYFAELDKEYQEHIIKRAEYVV